MEVLILSNKARFIQEQCEDKIDLRRKKQAVVIELLTSRDYAIVDEDPEYKYLRSMRIDQVEEENIIKLLAECDKKKQELEELRNQTPVTMWGAELKVLRAQYLQYKLNRHERQKGSGKKRIKGKKPKKIKVKN